MSAFPTLRHLPRDANLEGADDPTIFTREQAVTLAARDRNGSLPSILPNLASFQNKFTVFYRPRSEDNPLSNPVVGFYPLHKNSANMSDNERKERADYKGFRSGKNGASLDDVIGLVRYLFIHGPRKLVPIGSKHLLEACREMQKLSITVGIGAPLEDLIQSDSQLLHSMRILKNVNDEVEAIFLLMQWGPFNPGEMSGGQNGFLYKALLVLASRLAIGALRRLEKATKPKKPINESKKPTKKSKSNVNVTILRKVCDHLEEALRAMHEKKKEVFSPVLKERQARSVKPEMFNLRGLFLNYDPELLIYPAQAFNYLVEHEFLSKNAHNNLRAEFYHHDSEKKFMARVQFDPQDDHAIIYSHVDPKSGEVTPLFRGVFTPYAFLKVEAGDVTIPCRWEVKDVYPESKIAHFIDKDGKAVHTYVARLIPGTNIFQIDEPDFKGTFLFKSQDDGLDPTLALGHHLTIEHTTHDLNGLGFTSILSEVRAILTSETGEKEIRGHLDHRFSRISPLSHQVTKTVFSFQTTFDGENAKLLIFYSTYLKREETDETEEIFGRLFNDHPAAYKPGKVLVFNSPKSETLRMEPLFNLYHEYRSQYEPSHRQVETQWDQVVS